MFAVSVDWDPGSPPNGQASGTLGALGVSFSSTDGPVIGGVTYGMNMGLLDSIRFTVAVPSAVPEPGTCGLLTAGALLSAGKRRRREARWYRRLEA